MRRVPGSASRSDDLDAPLADAPVTPPAGAAARPTCLGFLAAVAAAGAVYFVLASLIYWPVPPLAAGRLPGCACGDPEQQTWFLAWTSYALTHGLNPFLTNYLHAPSGANLAIDTSMPLLGIVGMPITLLAGPVATFNLLLRLGLAASGAAMFGVLRRYVSWWPAAFLGGLLFAFSPYLANQAIRHLFLSFAPLVPLFIPLIDDWLVSRRRTPLRAGALIGLVAGLQYLISPETLLTSAIFAVAGLVFLALRHRHAIAGRAGVLALGLAAAIPVFLLVAGYPVWLLLAGPHRPRGPLHTLVGGLNRYGLNHYHADLLSPLYPTSHQLLATSSLAAHGDKLPAGSTLEAGFYLGLPLLALLGYLVIRCRRVPIVPVAVVIGVTAFILGLGPRLTLGGKVTGLPAPLRLLQYVPLLQDIEALRLSLYAQLAAAIILAVGLDHVRAHGRPRAAAPAAHGQPGNAGTPAWVRPAVTLAVGLVALVPLIPSVPFHSRPLSIPALFTSQAVSELPRGGVALTFPYEMAPQNQPMMWQLAADMRFRLLGGDVFVPTPKGLSTWHPFPAGPRVLTATLLAGTWMSPPPPPTGPSAVSAIRALCARSHIAMVLVDTMARYGKVIASLVGRALRTPPRRSGPIEVWPQVQRDLQRPG